MPGPLGRTVTDAAVLLTAMAGPDKNDPVTQDAAALAGVDFTRFLSVEAAKAARVGIIVNSDDDIETMLDKLGLKVDTGDLAEQLRRTYRSNNEKQRQIGRIFRDQGLEVVEVSGLALPESVDLNAAMLYGFKDAINRFLAGLDAWCIWTTDLAHTTRVAKARVAPQ